MADEPPKGRGRARGRARGQTQADRARRPGNGAGDPGRPQQDQPMPQMPPPADTHPSAAAGRKTHRGVPRQDAPGGMPPVASASHMQEESLTASMAAMDIRQVSAMTGRGRSRVEVDVCTRPSHCTDKKGMTGEPIQIVANFFELLSRPQWAVCQYHVDFAPFIESSRLRRALLWNHKETLGECFLFDGMSDLKSIRKLPQGVTELFSQRKSDDATIRITLKFVTELAPQHPELQRLFNTQMRRNLQHLKYQLLGRHYYDQEAISEVPQYNLQIWQGVITSIRTQEEKLMMCVDTTHKVVRKETALQIIHQIVSKQSPSYKEEISRDLVGCIVMTRYNNKTYSIEDIDWTLNPTKTFESREGPMVYTDYYKKQYDIIVRDLKQPLLLCKSKEKEIKGNASVSKKIYLIPELCCMTGLTDAMRSNFTLMREMAAYTRIDPKTRVQNLQTFIRRLNANETIQKEMRSWDLKFADDLVQFKARVCPPEMIVQRQIKARYNQISGDFSKEMRGNPMHTSHNLESWFIITTRFDYEKASDFLRNLKIVCPPMGMRVNQPDIITINDDRVNTYLNAFDENFIPRQTQLVCFIVPNNKKERYDALKKHTCLKHAIPSQVIVSRTLSKKPMLMSVATKIGIQMNCKLGGEPWALEIPFKQKVMIIGFDTYHDSSRRGRSAGAFVASMNHTFTRWYSRVTFHSQGGWEELSNYINLNFIEALKKYHEINKCNPDTIIYYRDGVGDGSIRYVMDWEVKPFKEVIQQKLQGHNVRFAYIIVNKKVNQRFFNPTRDGFRNPPPGTVIDNTVTRFDRYDFYLVSQSVRQGTVAPTLYNVIEDCTGLKPEHLQRLSYKLTHLYYNWPGTIRVPAPCQYAHKLAFLTGQSLHQVPQDTLCDTLFYL